MELATDLNKELIKHLASTFYGGIVGDSIRDEGIQEGDILVIDKSLELMDDDLAVYAIICFRAVTRKAPAEARANPLI